MTRSVGLLYLWSAEAIKKGHPNGIEGALGTSFFHLTLLCQQLLSRRFRSSTPFLAPARDQRPSSSYIGCNERCCGRVLRQDIVCAAR